MNKQPEIIYAAYLRKSSEDSSKQVLSIPAQRSELESLALKQGIIVTHWFEESMSAKDPGRPIFNQLMELVKTEKVQGIIAWKLDRLARNTVDGGIIQYSLQKGYLKEITTSERTHYSADNVFMTTFEFASSTQFVVDLSTNVKRGLRKRLELKKIPTGMAKFGFTNDKYKDKGDRGWLVNKEQLSLAKQMLDMYLSGNYSGGDIYNWAIQTGVLTTKFKSVGGKIIKRSQVYNLLSDPLYAGFFYDNGIRIELHDSLPRLITEEQHNKILRMLGNKNAPKTQKHEVTFSGYIYSPEGEFVGPDIKQQIICQCKYKFSYLNKTHCPKCQIEINKIPSPKYLDYTYYRNVPRSKRKESAKYIEESKVTEQFISYVQDNLLLSDELTEWCKKYFRELDDAEMQKSLSIETTQINTLQKLNSKKSKYREMYADGLISKEEYLEDIKTIDKDIQAINITKESQVDWLSKADEIVSLGKEFSNIFNSDNVKAKRSVLSKLGSNLIWNEQNISVVNPRPVQLLIDGLKTAKEYNNQFEPNSTLATKDKTDTFASVCPILLPRLDSNQRPIA